MAELTTPDTDTAASGCRTPAVQQNCCESSEKTACCETSAAGGSCGCGAGQSMPAAANELRETVRERYAAAARSPPLKPVAAGPQAWAVAPLTQRRCSARAL